MSVRVERGAGGSVAIEERGYYEFRFPLAARDLKYRGTPAVPFFRNLLWDRGFVVGVAMDPVVAELVFTIKKR